MWMLSWGITLNKYKLQCSNYCYPSDNMSEAVSELTKMYNSPGEYTGTKFKSDNDNKLSKVPKDCSVTIQVN